MAVTADQLRKIVRLGGRNRIKVAASTVIYDATIVIGHNDGYAYAAKSGTPANDIFLGIACEKYDNGSGSDGDVEGEVFGPGCSVWLPMSGAAQSDIGKKAYASDNYTVTTTSTDNILLGTIKDVGTNEVQIDLQEQDI